MKDFDQDSNTIAEFINTMTSSDILKACEMLNTYWTEHCEHTVCYFHILCWTFHNHAAKSVWAKLDYRLRLKLKLLHGDHQ